MSDGRDYAAVRADIKKEIEKQYPGMLLIPLAKAAAIYGYSDIQTARDRIGAPRVPNERRVVYYVGDIASDIAGRLIGNSRRLKNS